MAKTKGQCRDSLLRYLDEATKKGVDLAASKNADYRDKFNYFLDEAQRYVAQLVKIPAVFTVTQYDSNDPNYTGVFEYPMPSDYLLLDSVILKRDSRSYEVYKDYKWENNKRIILGFDDVGTFDIHYFKYPAEILPTADDSTELEIEDKAFDLVVLQAGIMATASDNPSLSSWLRSLYIEKVQNIVGQDVPTGTTVTTVYSMNM